MDNRFADNGLCSCSEGETCANWRFCETRNSPDGRKSLCEKITRFLVVKPFYQSAIAGIVQKLFPDSIVYDDEKDICTMLFESVLFEDIRTGITPLLYFVNSAPLSGDEKRLYKSWCEQTRYDFFVVEAVVPGKKVHLLDGENCYRIYESRGTTSMKAGQVIVARTVPFWNGWMIIETIVSFPSTIARELLRKSHGVRLSQFGLVQKYHKDRKQLRLRVED